MTEAWWWKHGICGFVRRVNCFAGNMYEKESDVDRGRDPMVGACIEPGDVAVPLWVSEKHTFMVLFWVPRTDRVGWCSTNSQHYKKVV